MSFSRRGVVMSATVVAAALVVSLAPGVGAQSVATQDDGTTSTSTTTTAPPTSLPDGTTTVPPVGETTTTTTIYTPPIPPELAEDPRVPFLVDPGADDGGDIPIAQRSFDPRSVTVLPERVAEAKKALAAAQADLLAAQARVAERSQLVTDLTAELDKMDGDVKAAVAEAARARKQLRDHAVTAYVSNRIDPMMLLDTNDFVDMGVARSYLDVVVRQHERLVKAYEQKKSQLTSGQAALASKLGEAQSVLTQTASQVPTAFAAVLAAGEQLRAYEAGAHAYVDGFVFPVAADVEFIDSWGYPRMTGTASAHWHEGTDIFAAYGSPLVASENGVIERLGSASLGGNKLWVAGESGTKYYYAHLSAFAVGITDGTKVRAGEVVGYVGDTGNAKGTSPHLHFEIHPDGGDAVNPYPLLKAAYGNRPVARATAPTPTLPTDPAVLSALAALAAAAADPAAATTTTTTAPPTTAPAG